MKRSHTIALLVTVALIGLMPITHAQPTNEQLERIAILVEEGKLDEAKIRTETLLEVFPDDPQLKKMAAMLAQRAKAAPPTPANPALDRIRSALDEKPVATPVPSGLSAMDRLEIQTVLTGADQALKIGDATLRATRLSALLARPVPETALRSTQPEWLTYWQARAVAALELDDHRHGWQAGQALLRLDALKSKDPALTQVMASLNLKEWLKTSVAEVIQAKSARYEPWLGLWTGSGSHVKKETGSAGTATLPYSGTVSLKVELSNDLSPRVRCEGTMEYYDGYPHYFGNNRWGWTFFRYVMKASLPGNQTFETWHGQDGRNYHQPSADYAGLVQAGTYELIQFEFSPNMNELTLFYRFTATNKSVSDKKIVFRLTEGGEQLTMSDNPFFTAVVVGDLKRK